MKKFYVVHGEANVGLAKLYKEAHWIDLGDGYQLVCAEFASGQDTFESHPLVVSLPHPQEPGATIGQSAAEHLSELGVTETSTVWDVAKAAAKRHPQMKLR